MPCLIHPQAKQGCYSSCNQYKCCKPLIPGCKNIQCHRVVQDHLINSQKNKKRKLNLFSRGIISTDEVDVADYNRYVQCEIYISIV